MDHIVPFCGSARTSIHNYVFLEGVKSALLAARGATFMELFDGEAESSSYRTWSDHERQVGLKALGRVYAGWGFSQAFYREKLYEKALGFKSLDDFLVGFWENWSCSKGNMADSAVNQPVLTPH